MFASHLFREHLPILIQNYQKKKTKLKEETGLTGTKFRQEMKRSILGPAFEELGSDVKRQVKNEQGQEVEDTTEEVSVPRKKKPSSRKKETVKTSSIPNTRERTGSTWIKKLYREFIRN